MVSAAMAHLLRVGAAWPKAFVLTLLDRPVHILEVPPKPFSNYWWLMPDATMTT